ncbi:TfuA-like protein [Streptomyces collinus]|uniref:TfuA-like protein n=1 Tax=Streptomyces collinus TaxID=42684 RepID=UPI0036C66B6F
MTTFLFAGPSLPRRVRESCTAHAVVLPPVEGGDLLRLGAQPGDVVGIIDGFFYRRPAVKHKEILALLASGVAVYGAASMGALRAAELADFGMTGVGRIYAGYRSGAIVADDEVTLLHGTEAEDYENLTEALVNIRFALEDAARLGVLDSATAARALTAMSRLPFTQRTLDALVRTLHRCGFTPAKAAAVEAVVRTAPDAKAADALQLIEQLRVAPQTAPAPVRVPNTVFLRSWRDRAQGFQDPAVGWIPEGEVHHLVQVLATDYPAFRESVAMQTLATDHAAQLGLPLHLLTALPAGAGTTSEGGTGPAPCDPDLLLKTVLARLRHLGLLAPDADSDEGLDRWCTADELAVLTPAARTAKAATRALFTKPELTGTNPFLAALKSSDGYTLAHEQLRQCLRFNQAARKKYPTLQLSQLQPHKILAHFSAQWGRVDMEDAVLERGFAAVQNFIDCARNYYLYDKSHRDAPLLISHQKVRPTTFPNG